MASEQPKADPDTDRQETELDTSDDRKTEDGATVEEESEQSFPASDPPSY